jgi:diguanylate cyclase (GGDEF)-like protein
MRHHAGMIDGESLSLLVTGADGSEAWCTGARAALAALGWEAHDAARHGPHPDAVLWRAPDAAALAELRAHPGLATLAHDSALVVHADADWPAEETALLKLGAEALLAGDDMRATARALRHAVWRKRVEQAARRAYATDLATGLPHQTQLLEHMTQLLALREREPAPMVLLVLRVDGFVQAEQRLGAEAGNVLRRKVAVRLRGGLRASDVVASLTPEAFGVLLGRLESKHDGERVAAKLVKALELPLSVAGQPCRVTAHVGLAVFPDHGKDAQALLQRASAQAASVATVGPQGFAGATVHRIGGPAANDQP